MPDPLKERIALLEMGETQGKLKPEHQAELNGYRQKGLSKTRAPAAATGAQPADDGSMRAETASGRDKARQAMGLIDRVQPYIDRVAALQKTVLGAKGLKALNEYNPFDEGNQKYDAAVAALTSAARPATRTPGEGSMSDFESKLATAALPNRWKRDSYNEESLRGLQALVDSSRKIYGAQLGLPAAPPKKQAAAKPAAASSGGWTVTRRN